MPCNWDKTVRHDQSPIGRGGDFPGKTRAQQTGAGLAISPARLARNNPARRNPSFTACGARQRPRVHPEVLTMKRMVSRVSGRGIRVACAAAGLSALLSGSAAAQSTLFNIPSTDTVAAGNGYFEFDWLPQATVAEGAARINIFNPRFLAGLPNNVEVGVNFPIYHSGDFDPSSLAYIQPNIKWKFFNNDTAGVAASAGVVVNTPLNSREGQGTWSYLYGNVSKKWMGTYGPRVTFGPYGVVADQDSGDATFIGKKGGVLLGYEQPLGGPVSFVADWFSGKNSIGYFTPGVSIVLPRSGLLNIGYSFGNDSFENSNATKNRYVFIYYGVTF
jgi:hypothetical protein